MLPQNQNQAGTALQVFYNLNLLTRTVDDLMTEYESKIETSIDQTVDQQKLSANNETALASGEMRNSVFLLVKDCHC